MSIYDGISLSKYEYVMWLDADGSMPPETVGKLLEKSATDRETVFIGSRFSNGGGNILVPHPICKNLSLI